MSLWKIAWRSIQQRSLASALTALSMALGVGLVVAVLVIHGVLGQSFRRSAQGYDLILGAKGSRLELVLSTVFHLYRPTANIPAKDYYTVLSRYEAEMLAIPVCMGDTFKQHRVIGTTPDMFDELEYRDGKKYEFQEGGRNFTWDGHFEAVIGATVARRTGLKVGGTFPPVHGDTLGHRDQRDFTVVGILKPTGTPNDRAIFVNVEGFYDLHKKEAGDSHAGSHEKPEGPSATATAEKAPPGSAGSRDGAPPAGASSRKPRFDESREVTAVLVVFRTPNMPRRVAIPKEINRDRELQLQAVAPAEEVTKLFEGIIGNVQWILLFLAILIVIVAGIGILVSIYNSMSDRRHEIAIMRALGARRVTVMMTVLCESILLALGGGAIGVLLGHGLTGLLAPIIDKQTGVVVSPLQFQTSELVLIPGLILLATVVGYLPAVVAYRTDVAQSLIASP